MVYVDPEHSQANRLSAYDQNVLPALKVSVDRPPEIGAGGLSGAEPRVQETHYEAEQGLRGVLEKAMSLGVAE